MKKYTDLTSRHREQPAEEVFAHFGYDGNRNETWETPYERLARIAKPEEWNFQRPEFKNPHENFPILKNYLNYTFRRLQKQEKIRYSGDRACFNTGLQTPFHQDIFATFYRNKQALDRKQPDWTLFNFFDSYSKHLTEFRPLPDIATYIGDNASDLVFDTSYNIDVNYQHLFDDNRDRLPDELRDNPTLAIAAIKGAMDILKSKIIRNYKLAIPQWYSGHIQLLLPLHLMDENEADLALVAEKDQSSNLYRIRTILSMNMAYIHARRITRPDREWLNP